MDINSGKMTAMTTGSINIFYRRAAGEAVENIQSRRYSRLQAIPLAALALGGIIFLYAIAYRFNTSHDTARTMLLMGEAGLYMTLLALLSKLTRNEAHPDDPAQLSEPQYAGITSEGGSKAAEALMAADPNLDALIPAGGAVTLRKMATFRCFAGQ